MQLEDAAAAPMRPASIRGRLGAAACVLLASATPALAQSDSAATWQLEGAALLYGELNRADVVEPVARVTRLFPNGQTLSAQFTLDVITGASPSGAMPPTSIQTTTTASGGETTLQAGQIPTTTFKDTRGALGLEWARPYGGWLVSTLGTHASREKDYQSLGANAKLAIDFMRHLTTLTLGGGVDHDRVSPVGGTPDGLSDGSVIVRTSSNSKRVATAMAGLSRVLTRRWMIAVNATRTSESGYLTEPYKLVSLLDGGGTPVGSLTDKRPSSRERRSLLTSSVYHLTEDVVYASHRYYRDDWGVRSNTFDLRYRRELGGDHYLQPHVRFYTQTPADFFGFGLVSGAPPPAFATSDYRLGPLRTITLGATYGFGLPNAPGELSLRAEYLRQYGDGHPASAIGAQRQYDLFPALNVGSLVIGYSVEF